MNERQIIEHFQELNLEGGRGLLRGIGDDCAVIEKDISTSWLVTIDTLVESIHFDLGWHTPEKLGYKAVAVNVSDIGAMGGEPVLIFLSLGLPSGFDDSWVQLFSKGIARGCREYKCMLAGGDTVRSNKEIMITLTAMGEVPSDQVVYRSGARVGDTVWVSGALGMAAAGLGLCKNGLKPDTDEMQRLIEKHLEPIPRLRLARLLAENHLAHAMMDLSDGLATDLSHLCVQSGTGAIVHSTQLPVLPGLSRAADLLGKDSLELALMGGEDYELLFTAAAEAALDIKALSEQEGVPITAVGTIVEDQGVHLIFPGSATEHMKKVDISFKGFDHFPENNEK